MSLSAALQIGRSAINASQAAIQVAGNNMANAATPGYHRQVATLTPSLSERIGPNAFAGTGVMLRDIGRVVDTALQSRVRTAVSREAGSQIDRRFLSSIESLQNELSDNDLSSKLSEFLNAFSELANNPDDDAVRSLVLRQAGGIADHVVGLRQEYDRVRTEIDRSLGAGLQKADGLLDQIAAINGEITQTEGGVGKANGLRDRRDALVDELSKLIDVSTIEQPSGAIDVLVGSLPVVLGGVSRGVELRTQSVNGELTVEVRIKADGSTLDVVDGEIGALMRQRSTTVDPAIDALDTFAHELIYQANRVHSQGQGKAGWPSVTGLERVASNIDPLSSAASDLPFDVRNGSFFLHVTNAANGLRQSAQILVDPSSMSLDGLVAAINTAGLSNVTASTTADGRLKIDATAGYTLTFSDDSSGTLAALGVNALFGGQDATDIALNQALLDNPRLLAAGRGHLPGSNASALAMVALEDLQVEPLGGRSLRGFWQSVVSDHAVRTAAAIDAADSATIVRESLSAQEQSVSGVSLDEESVDLLTYQRQFQAAAKFIATIDEVMQTLLNIR
ncbi:MAG: flagellar hook-associated protein FlgK [Phycisphaerae bacterium]|nr:flagellar hook-associated protein FlgK [Phycisphaerae bacterium]